MRTLPKSKDEGAGARTFQGEGSFSKMVKVEKSGAFEKLVNKSKKKKKREEEKKKNRQREHKLYFLYAGQALAQ